MSGKQKTIQLPSGQLAGRFKLRAGASKFGSEDAQYLFSLRKNNPFRVSFVTGITEALERAYRSRVESANYNNWLRSPAAKAFFRRAAGNIVELGANIESFLDCAWETKPRDLKWPTPQILAGDYMRGTYPSWAAARAVPGSGDKVNWEGVPDMETTDD